MRLRRLGDPRVRNYGCGSRSLKKSAINLLAASYDSYVTRALLGERINYFLDWLGEHYKAVTDLRDIQRFHIEGYGDHLRYRIDTGTLAVASGHNYLSAVNQLMKLARGNSDLTVRAVHDAKLRKRRKQPLKLLPAAPSEPLIAKNFREEILLALMALQYTLGLRLEESIKLDATAAVKLAMRSDRIQIERGTKGGRSRTLQIKHQSQIEALATASKLQKKMSHRSLCPPEMSYVQFKRWCYRQIRKWGLKYSFHANRHAYARAEYHDVAGFPCPADLNVSKKEHRKLIAAELSLSQAEVRHADNRARTKTSLDLGHSRIDVVSAYCG